MIDHSLGVRNVDHKCPMCGSFGSVDDEERVCPSCLTRFNNFVILEVGRGVEIINN